MPASYVGLFVLSLAVLLPIQLPVNESWEVTDYGSNAWATHHPCLMEFLMKFWALPPMPTILMEFWAPVTHANNPDGILGSWLEPDQRPIDFPLLLFEGDRNK